MRGGTWLIKDGKKTAAVRGPDGKPKPINKPKPKPKRTEE